MESETFDSNDAWILWAIPPVKEGTDLRGLISAADALNHAIPDRSLIEKSINRGLRSGLLEISGDRIRFVPRHRKKLEEAHGVSKKWFKQLDAVYEYLASRDWPAISESRYSLSKRQYYKVVEGYMNSF